MHAHQMLTLVPKGVLNFTNQTRDVLITLLLIEFSLSPCSAVCRGFFPWGSQSEHIFGEVRSFLVSEPVQDSLPETASTGSNCRAMFKHGEASCGLSTKSVTN